jgi:hypothetical protein
MHKKPGAAHAMKDEMLKMFSFSEISIGINIRNIAFSQICLFKNTHTFSLPLLLTIASKSLPFLAT